MSSIRETLEQHELEALAPGSRQERGSRGRLRPETEDDVRPAFQRDRDRIIHSKAFRRLKHKTQVFFAPAGDHYRTRLTHSLEVSQIARTIAKVLRLHEELTEAIALGHDLGHTPFGHAGEQVLDTLVPGRLPPLRAEPAHRRRARGRRPRPQPELGGARRHRPALEGQERVAGRPRPGQARVDARGSGDARRRPDRVRESRHRRRGARRGAARGRPAARPRWRVLGDSSSARIARMVKDVVTETSRGGLGEIRMSEEVLEATLAMRAFLFTRRLRERDRHGRVQEGRRHPGRAVGTSAGTARRVPRSANPRGRRRWTRRPRTSWPA